MHLRHTIFFFKSNLNNETLYKDITSLGHTISITVIIILNLCTHTKINIHKNCKQGISVISEQKERKKKRNDEKPTISYYQLTL